MAASSSAAKPLIAWREEDKEAEEFWNALPGMAEDLMPCQTFAEVLAEEWNCHQVVTEVISKALIGTYTRGAEDVISKDSFYFFVRAFGPWATGDKNPMLRLILRDFFESDQRTFRGHFHGHMDEKRSYALLKEPGDYFYRYSARNLDAICVVRASFHKNERGEAQRATEMLGNTRQGTWQLLVKDKMDMYSSLSEFELKNNTKLVRVVRTGAAAHGFYAASMTTEYFTPSPLTSTSSLANLHQHRQSSGTGVLRPEMDRGSSQTQSATTNPLMYSANLK